MSCSPAKLASALSSLVALERTATGRSASPHSPARCVYPAATASTTSGGSGVVESDVPANLRDVPSISDEEIAELVAIAREVEAHYGCPQDIEWAVSRTAPAGENILLLQSRPETVWAEKDVAAAKPTVAAPTARAFDHVFNALGGKRPTEG